MARCEITIPVRFDPLLEAFVAENERNAGFRRDVAQLIDTDRIVKTEVAGGMIVAHFTDEALAAYYKARGV